MEGLKRSDRILAEFVKSIPAAKLHLRRGDGFWTIAEHLNHLAQVQSMLLERMQRFMDEDRPEFVPYIPGDDGAGSRPSLMEMDDALEAFARRRRQQVELLERADSDVWRKTASHPEYEQYSLYILVRHILMHDHWHMYRMEELWLAQDAYLTKLG